MSGQAESGLPTAGAGSGADNAERPWTVAADGSVRLLASLEQQTGSYFFPPLPPASPVARRCKKITLAPEAAVYSHTTVFPGAKTGKAPYALVYADFPEGVRVLGRFRSPAAQPPQIGARVRVQVEAAADGSIDYMFTPVE